MKDVMGLIYTGENDIHLGELTSVRAVAALPIAGRYRVIDFQLSSMTRTGIKRVGIITQKNYQSLMDHLGSGREWDLHGKVGLHILPPFVTRDNQGMYDGLLDSLRSNLDFLRLSAEKYIVLTNSHSIYNMDYSEAIQQHIETGADITVFYAQPSEAFDGEGFEGEADAHFTVDSEAKVIKAMEVGESHPTCACPSLKIYVAERETLLHLVERSSANGYHHFGRDLIQRNIKDGTLKICGYEYKGYCCQIDSIQAYFNFNQTVMTEKVRKALFPAEYPVYTKVRDDMPARYEGEGKCSNSLVGNGCIIEGTVINSVLFRGVKVAKGAVVKNSVLMQDVQIQSGAELDHCILDKSSVIRRNGRLIAPAAYPIVIAKNVVI